MERGFVMDIEDLGHERAEEPSSDTVTQLTHVFKNNFVSYFRSHAAHVNITGRNFYSDHKLLQKIYEDLQDQIDRLGELLRSLDAYMPCSITDVVDSATVSVVPIEGSADMLLMDVSADLEQLEEDYEELMKIAEREDHEEIANYAQDRILTLNKFQWMLRSTLEG